MTKEELEELTLEAALERVDKTLTDMAGDIPLEDAFALYKNGIELLNYCDEKLKKIDEQVSKLVTENNEIEEFNVE